MRVIHLVSNPVWGGGERYVLDLSATLMADGHDVTVVTRPYKAVTTPFEKEGLRIVTMPLRGILDPISPLRLAHLYDSVKGDTVVHVHNFKTARIALAAKGIARYGKSVRIVCTRHLVQPAKTSIRNIHLYNSLDAIVFVSALARDMFLSSCPAVNTARLHVVYNSIRLPSYYQIPEKGVINSSNIITLGSQHKDCPCIRLLFMGRVSEEKGIDTLIKSLKYLKDEKIELAIVGTGSDSFVESLKDLAKSLNVEDRILWFGYQDNVYAEINKSDICVAPSKWREPFGLVLLEFMSQGKPVVTTNNGAQKEIITDGVDGLLVDPDNPIALAYAIRILVNDISLRACMGENARQRFVEQFTYTEFYKQILDIYHG